MSRRGQSRDRRRSVDVPIPYRLTELGKEACFDPILKGGILGRLAWRPTPATSAWANKRAAVAGGEP